MISAREALLISDDAVVRTILNSIQVAAHSGLYTYFIPALSGREKTILLKNGFYVISQPSGYLIGWGSDHFEGDGVNVG